MASHTQGKSRGDGAGSAKSGLGVIPERVQPLPTKTLWLHYKKGSQAGKRLVVAQDRALIGRHDTVENILVDVDLSDFETGEVRPSISRRHAEIVRTADGWLIVDLNSANGTHVDGQRLKPGQAQPLRPGCLLTLGRLEFVIEDE